MSDERNDIARIVTKISIRSFQAGQTPAGPARDEILSETYGLAVVITKIMARQDLNEADQKILDEANSEEWKADDE